MLVFALTSYVSLVTVVAQHEGHAPPPAAAPKTEASAPAEAPEAPRVEIPVEKQQLIGIKTVKVAVKPLQKTIRTVGKVEYDESRIATVNTKIEGWIEKLHVNLTGQYVKKGAPLAEIYSPELYASQQEFLNVLKWAKKQDRGKQDDPVSKMVSADTENIVNAARQRLKFWDISDCPDRQNREDRQACQDPDPALARERVCHPEERPSRGCGSCPARSSSMLRTSRASGSQRRYTSTSFRSSSRDSRPGSA